MKDKEKQEKVFDILNKFEFFQGQRAGRELWNDKPKEMQDKDIADFIKDINYIRSYLQDSVVLTREEYELMENELRDKVYQACKLEKQKTAEKIINHFVKEFPILKTRVVARELAKQFGVEIKE